MKPHDRQTVHCTGTDFRLPQKDFALFTHTNSGQFSNIAITTFAFYSCCGIHDVRPPTLTMVVCNRHARFRPRQPSMTLGGNKGHYFPQSIHACMDPCYRWRRRHQEEQGSGSEMPENEKGGPPPADTACQWSDQKRSLGQEIASFRRIDVEPPRTSVLGRFLEGKSPSTGGQAARETTICRRSGGKQSQRAERPARPAW